MKNLTPDLLICYNKMHSHYAMEHFSGQNMENPHIHEHYEILYVPKGNRTLIMEKKNEFTLTPNTIAFIPPYVRHQTKGPLPYARFLVNVTKPIIEEIRDLSSLNLLECFDASHPLIEFSDKDLKIITNILKQMIDLNDHDDIYSDSLFALLLGQLLTIALRNNNQQDMNSDTNPHVFLEITNYLEKNFGEDITLNTLSNKFYINKYDISRKFTQQIGISFSKYLSRIRVNNAKTLLETTNMNITQIATLSGFQSSSNFARVFKSIIGMTLTDYRIHHNSEK